MSKIIGKAVIDHNWDTSTKEGTDIYWQHVNNTKAILQKKLDDLGVPSCCSVRDTFPTINNNGDTVIEFIVECRNE